MTSLLEYPLLAMHVRIVSAFFWPWTWKEYLPSGVTARRYPLLPLHSSRSVRTFRCVSVSGTSGFVAPAHAVKTLATRRNTVALVLLSISDPPANNVATTRRTSRARRGTSG